MGTDTISLTATELADLRLNETELAASLCAESLWDFVQEFWAEIIEEPLVPNWHMEYLCRELEKIADRVFRRLPKIYDLLINIPPGTSKSTICSVMFPIWVWTRAPWVQTICGSYSQELSLDLSMKSRTILLSERFKAMYPHIRLRWDQNTKTFFVNTSGGWRYATSTGGTVTGKHGHIIVVDDPVDPRRALSPADLQAAKHWLTDVIDKRKVDQRRTPIIMIMQRLAVDDPSALWLELKKKGRAIRHICLPAEASDQVRPPELAKYYVDGLLEPIRLSREVLVEQKLVGEVSYAAQYQQDPMAPGVGMFDVTRLKIEPLAGPKPGWRLCRYWDKAATLGGGAYTVGVLMARTEENRFVVLDVVRGQWDAATRERVIKHTAQLDGLKVTIVVEQEPGSGGKESAEATIRNLAGYRALADRPTGNKLFRADPFAAQVNAGNVTLAKGDWNRAYIAELAAFSEHAEYKDQVDASSGALAFLTKRRVRLGGF